MVIADFSVPYKEDLAEQTEDILYDCFVERRINQDKPCVIAIDGGSGEGKSETGLKITDVIFKRQGIDLLEWLDYVEVYTPFEYATKLNNILFSKDPNIKKLNVFIIDEARIALDSDKWRDFVQQAIDDVQTLSRGIKPMIFIFITNTLKNIQSSSRYTINYEIEVGRAPNNPAEARIFRFGFDNRDPDKIKFVKSTMMGLIQKDGIRYRVYPSKIVMRRCRPELVKKYKDLANQAKTNILLKKMELMQKRLEKETGYGISRIEAMFLYYSEHREEFQKILIKGHKRLTLDKDFVKAHDLTNSQVKEFLLRMEKKLVVGGDSSGVLQTTTNQDKELVAPNGIL